MITYDVQEKTITFIFREDINFETVRQIETKVREVTFPEPPGELVIDLAHVRFIDSTGVGFLISWIHPLLSHYQIRIINSSLPVKNILQICKLDTLVEII
ncbi:STAS domain-containing protein [Aneurinibacillus sp. BA2021]|nr:STAS domain-containing protein [Aneurinibacillus sp. BA2021]